jgi:hypothetical protein
MEDKQFKYLFLILMFTVCSCSVFKYGKAVKKDAQNNFSIHKDFLVQLGFTAIVTDKVVLDKIDNGANQLSAKIYSTDEKLPLGRVQYPPYYIFDSQEMKSLKILVSDQVFNTLSIGDTIIKRSNNDSIFVKHHRLLLLSKENDKWIP